MANFEIINFIPPMHLVFATINMLNAILLTLCLKGTIIMNFPKWHKKLLTLIVVGCFGTVFHAIGDSMNISWLSELYLFMLKDVAILGLILFFLYNNKKPKINDKTNENIFLHEKTGEPTNV